MCIYPKIIKNPKYKVNKKNGGNVPIVNDERVLYVPIGCGRCIECRNQKKRQWQVRLFEEIKTDNSGKFVTLTFNDEELMNLSKEFNFIESNAIATIAVRRFLENWRKETGKSVKHWLITELGHENTERIHLHGILFTDKDNDFIQKKWKYGNIWVGTFVNNKTINYIIKYVTKIDTQHKGFEGVILTSPGIGKNYLNTYDAKKRVFNDKNTIEYYKTPTGHKINLPIYYRNHLFNEDEREKLWINKLNEEIRYLNGLIYRYKTDQDIYNFEMALRQAQRENIICGYGTGDDWKNKEYNTTVHMLKKLKSRQNNK